MLLVQADDGPQPGPCVGPRHRHFLLPSLQGAAAHTQGDQVGSLPDLDLGIISDETLVTNIEISFSVFDVV